MAFHVGQKVVCVDDTNMRLEPQERGPVYGEVYTVRGFYDCDGIWLSEIKNDPVVHTDGFTESAFYIWRFRPLIERKTDISIFTEMLKPKQRELCGNE